MENSIEFPHKIGNSKATRFSNSTAGYKFRKKWTQCVKQLSVHLHSLKHSSQEVEAI